MTELPDNVASTLRAVRSDCAGLGGGEVASYIPELARADPELLAVSLCGVGGEVWDAGDASAEFTIQSICKPLLYALALDVLGFRAVLGVVSIEPSGDRFDSLIGLHDGRPRPPNPLVNAGAIAVAGLLADSGVGLDRLSAFTAQPVVTDEAVYRSERATADRNRAISHLLAHFELVVNAERALDYYLRACSVRVTCRDLSVVAATLANGGTNPTSGKRVASADSLEATLTVMATCGMYDGSGSFAMEVGLPAKSGVSGGIIAVAPEVAGIAAFAPPLDGSGNSVRGRSAVAMLSDRFGWDVFDARSTPHDAGTIDVTVAAVADRQRFGRGGEVSDYTPELAAADRDAYALACCDIRGRRYVRGQAAHTFSIQGAANPFCYAMALQICGIDAVHRRVGCEPSGNAFDSILLEPGSGRPHNALGNAGALVIAELLGDAPALAPFAGAALDIDADMLVSERRVQHRNLAIAYLLRDRGWIGDVERSVEAYLRHCTTRVDCAMLARMAAVLAHGGRDPDSGERIVSPEVARTVVAMMFSCGMHDDSGVFAFEVGVPAKSGLSGAIVAVVPGVMGIATYSPRVSSKGASIRGWASLRDLAGTLGLGLFSPTRTTATAREDLAPG